MKVRMSLEGVREEVGAHSGAHFQLVSPDDETEIGNIMERIEGTGAKPADMIVRGNASGFLQAIVSGAHTGRTRWSPTPDARDMFRHRRRMRDPLLVFNMSIFNFDDGWNRIFSQFKIHENGA